MSLSQSVQDQLTDALNSAYDSKKVDPSQFKNIKDDDLKKLVEEMLAGQIPPGYLIVAFLDVQVTGFTYGAVQTASSPSQELGSAMQWSNKTCSADSFTQAFSNTSTASFTWTVTEGLQVGVTAKYTAGVPAALGTEVSVSAQLSFQASQSTTTTTTQTWSITANITVPKLSVITAVMVVEQVQLSVPWNATCTLGPTSKVSQSDFDFIVAGFYPGKTLADLLPGSLMNQQTSGTLTGIYGTAAQISTTQTSLPSPCSDSPAPADAQFIEGLSQLLS